MSSALNDGVVTRRGTLLFVLLGVTWGIPYLLIKIAVGQLDPAMVVLARTALAAAVLLPVAVARGQLWPVLRRWRPLVCYTVAEIIVPQFLLSTAEQRLPSSTTGLLIAAVPLAGVGVAFLLGRPERLNGRNWLGIALGMAGVAALVGFAVSGSDLGAVGMVMVVVVGYALGPAIIAKWMPDLPGTGITALSFLLSAVAYAPVVAATGGWPAAWPSASVIVSVVLLAVVCSAGAFSILIALVAEIGPVRTTTVTYVNPAVALVAGALVLGEPITAWSILGFALILAGCFLAASRRPGKSARPASPAAGIIPVDEVSPAAGANLALPISGADDGAARQPNGLLSALRYRAAAGDRSSLHGGTSGRRGAA
jgi:drug/metabolite transporter (DMT)-like permease